MLAISVASLAAALRSYSMDAGTAVSTGITAASVAVATYSTTAIDSAVVHKLK